MTDIQPYTTTRTTTNLSQGYKSTRTKLTTYHRGTPYAKGRWNSQQGTKRPLKRTTKPIGNLHRETEPTYSKTRQPPNA